MVIDLFGLEADDVRRRFPEVYQQIKTEVKEKTVVNRKGKIEYVGRDWNNREYRRTGRSERASVEHHVAGIVIARALPIWSRPISMRVPSGGRAVISSKWSFPPHARRGDSTWRA